MQAGAKTATQICHTVHRIQPLVTKEDPVQKDWYNDIISFKLITRITRIRETANSLCVIYKWVSSVPKADWLERLQKEQAPPTIGKTGWRMLGLAWWPLVAGPTPPSTAALHHIIFVNHDFHKCFFGVIGSPVSGFWFSFIITLDGWSEFDG